MRSALQRVGNLRDSGHEHFNGSIVVPLFSARTAADGTPRHVVGAYGRKLLDNLRAGTPKHLYLQSAAVQGAQSVLDDRMMGSRRARRVHLTR